MSESRLVWSDEQGDLRKSKNSQKQADVNENNLILKLRRLTSGKGRAVIELTGLPSNKNWCKKLAKDLKKSLGVGGAYKSDYIEIHGEKLEAVCDFLDKRSIRWKQIGG